MLSATTRSGPPRDRWDSLRTPRLPAGSAGLTETKPDIRIYRSIIVSFLLVFFSAQAQSGVWTKKADLPRGGGSACVVNDKIYVVGGTTGAPGYTDLEFNEAYDPSTDTWVEKTPMPTPRGFLSTAVVNGIVYALGGGYPAAKSNVEAYDPVANTWTPKATMISPRLGAHAGVVNGIIYNVGGNYSQRSCEAYKPSTNTWSAKTNMPESGGVCSVTVYDGILYAIGGGYYGANATVCAYDPKEDTWTTKKSMPTPRFAFQTYLLDDKIYAIGGAQSEGGRSLATVEVYDPVADTWQSEANMPDALAWFAGAVVNGKIYVIGGTPNWGITMSSSVWEYDPGFHTEIPAGNVSGTWLQANSPYHINGEITIPNDSTLLVKPGVKIVFTGHYKFNVQGRLLAEGTPKDSITFTAADIQTGWHGIRFNSTPSTNDTSKFAYCVFKHGKANTGDYSGLDRDGGAMFIRGFSKVSVSHSLFESNMNDGYIAAATGGAAIFAVDADPQIRNCMFSNNTGTTDCAILCWNTKAVISKNTFVNNSGPHGPVFCAYNAPTISENVISRNVTTRAGGGIFTMTTSATITNNIIVNNSSFGGEGEGGGIKCWINDKSIVMNNTIAYNSAAHGGGICCNSNSDPIFINNIIWGNTSSDGPQVNLLDTQSDPYFLYCDIQGRKEGFGGNGAGANYTGTYESNIDLDPLFTNTESTNYTLKSISHCIGAGCDSAQIDGTWYHAARFCIMGIARPTPKGTLPDIGACESLLGVPTLDGIEHELAWPTECLLHQNYPNPFNPSTTIRYELPRALHVSLTVHDVLGREVATLVNGVEQAGHKSAQWHASGVSSGIYFLRLAAGRFVDTKRLLLLR